MQNPYMGKKQTGVPKGGEIRTRTYREALKSKVGANALELRFNFASSHCQSGGAPFFEGPWELNRGQQNIARGNVIAFHKQEILFELCRQVNYFIQSSV